MKAKHFDTFLSPPRLKKQIPSNSKLRSLAAATVIGLGMAGSAQAAIWLGEVPGAEPATGNWNYTESNWDTGLFTPGADALNDKGGFGNGDPKMTVNQPGGVVAGKLTFQADRSTHGLTLVTPLTVIEIILPGAGSGGTGLLLEIGDDSGSGSSGSKLTVSNGITLTNTVGNLDGRTRLNVQNNDLFAPGVTVNAGDDANSEVALSSSRITSVNIATINLVARTHMQMPWSNVTWSGKFTGTGRLFLSGGDRSGSSLTLSNTGNDFSGGLVISTGRFTAGVLEDGEWILASVGTGDIQVTSNGFAQITNNNMIADTASLIIDDNTAPRLDLNFTGTDTVAGITVNGIALDDGTYDSSNTSWIIGTGALQIVPEPTVTGLLGLAGLVVMLRRRRA